MSGPFEMTIAFQPWYGSETWDFLMDGHGTIELEGMGPPILLCEGPVTWPWARVDQVSLVVDGEFPVAAAKRTWGAIKAIYR